MKKSYKKFIEDKIIKTPNTGFSVDDTDLHHSNLPHQRDIIKWAAKGGCRAIFASFGMGKTQMQLELMRLAIGDTSVWNEGQFGLIICPLGVKQEFKKDASRLGMEIQYVKNDDEIINRKTPFLITNYERVRDGNITIKNHTTLLFVSLDEASVLRSYGSKTYQEFLPMFQQVAFKYVCTATPSPNRYKEIIHYAGFLGIMDTGQALTRWFKRDSTKANNLTLYEHKEREFWLWVSSWAIFITKPSDLGYSDEGYDLPKMHIHWKLVKTEAPDVISDRDGQIKAFKDVAVSLSEAAKEKRESILERVVIADEIINEHDKEKHWLVWHHLESERDCIESNIHDVVSVYGSQDESVKEDLLIGFANGDFRILATKPSIAGQGCNFQYHCADAIFLGINYEFNDFIQAIHRIHRFQQNKEVNIYIIYTEAEEHIKRELEAKWVRHNILVEKMTDIIQQYGLTNITAIGELKRSIGIERKEIKGEFFTYVNNDSVEEFKLIESNRFGMGITSIPFSNHYEYTPSYNDFGHTNNDDHFFAQMDYLTPNVFRTLQPGRIQIVHVKDRILFGNVTGHGVPTVNPFHAKTIFHYLKHGFLFLGMITIETDVVRENNQTYRLGWTEQCKDGSKMGVGSPEYILIFRKPQTDNTRAYADVPVIKTKQEYTRGRWQIDARAKWNSSGNTLLTPEEIRRLGVDVLSDKFSNHFRDFIYDYYKHCSTADALDVEGKLPATFEMLKVPARTGFVWDDVVRMRTLNSRQTQSKEQNHICPFQLDIVDRCIERWSNPGDEIADCFGGIGSVGVESITLGRRAFLCELNSEYFHYGVGYCKEAEYKRKVPTLFDCIKQEEVA